MATVLVASGRALPNSASSSTSSTGGNDKLEKEVDVSVSTDDDVSSLGAPHDEKRFWFQRAKGYDSSAIATQPSVFDNPMTATEYQPRADWENLHRFNPLARWTWGEEYKIIRKIDLKIMVFACVMFMALELDRANIKQANTDDFLEDLGLTTNDYNTGNAVFKLSFLCAELPSQLVSKWIGPDRWIPAQMCLWSIVAASQFWLSGRSSFLACRSLLGILQGGFIPDIILYLSYFYKHHELTIRLSFFWMAMSFADIIAGFLAVGLLQLRGVEGLAGWRWLFLIEGLFTFLVGLSAFGLMPASLCHTANWFRGKKGWFTAREEEIMVNRVIREDPSKSGMHNRQPVTPRLMWQSLKDFDLWPLYILGLVFQIPMIPPEQYLQITLKNLGFDTVQANLLSIPYTAIHIVLMLALAYSAEVFGQLTWHALAGQIWAIPFLIYLNVVDISHVGRWVLWGVITVLIGYPNAHPIQVAWNSRNSNAVRSRTVSAACYNMFVQAGGVIASYIYQQNSKTVTSAAPDYTMGNRALLGIACGNVVIYVLVKLYYVSRNKSRDRKWDAMTDQQKTEYLATTTDEGNKRLDFRFAH